MQDKVYVLVRVVSPKFLELSCCSSRRCLNSLSELVKLSEFNEAAAPLVWFVVESKAEFEPLMEDLIIRSSVHSGQVTSTGLILSSCAAPLW